MCPPDSGFMKLTCRPICSCNPKSIPRLARDTNTTESLCVRVRVRVRVHVRRQELGLILTYSYSYPHTFICTNSRPL